MTPDRDPQTRADAERFDLLEHPERWPEDAASQARLAELLELHLALQAHGPELANATPTPRRPIIAFQQLQARCAQVLQGQVFGRITRLFGGGRTPRAHAHFSKEFHASSFPSLP